MREKESKGEVMHVGDDPTLCAQQSLDLGLFGVRELVLQSLRELEGDDGEGRDVGFCVCERRDID